MLAQVLAGFQAAGVVPQLSLFDRCATPIKLNQWFAERHGQTIEATVSDAASYASDAAFDVVCTHCFLGYFTKDERPALFAKWNALLRPGGYVVTVNPIRNVDNDDFVGFGEQQAAAFAARALAAAKDNPEACSGRTDELARRVRAFTDNFGSYPVRSVAEFRGLFEDAGFAVEECENLTDGSGSGGPTEKSLIYQSAVARRL